MHWSLKGLRSMSKAIAILAFLAVSLQQVVSVKLQDDLKNFNSDNPDREHMENNVNWNTIFALGTLNRLKYDGTAETSAPTFAGPSIKRRSSSNLYAYKKGCIRRNGACDNRPSDCCYSSSCRCNLWGSNCRCQRIGLFQKWG